MDGRDWSHQQPLRAPAAQVHGVATGGLQASSSFRLWQYGKELLEQDAVATLLRGPTYGASGPMGCYLLTVSGEVHGRHMLSYQPNLPPLSQPLLPS